ncbi:MAG TPA: lysophospholipid acyltransferase family protein [Bryobacteraceae bacterium]|nr:lysophospholipid acyltransferase family protein [Bryobacteraceae bacterium]
METLNTPVLTVDDLLWFLYLYPLRVLSALVPRGIMYSIGRLFQVRARKRRDLATRRIRTTSCTGILRDRAPQIADNFLANSAIRMLDDLVLSWPSFPRKLRCNRIQGLENLEHGRSAGKGVILLTAHFCAIRVARRYLAAIGHPILAVRDETQPGDWWGRFGRRMLAPRRMEFLQAIIGESVSIQDPECALKILRRLRSGGLVNIHFDGQSGTRTTPWSFLGTPRHFSTGIFDLVRLSECAVVPMLCLGRSSAFRIEFGAVLDIVRAAGRDEFLRANLPAFVETIEKQIMDYPEEWEQWMSL